MGTAKLHILHTNDIHSHFKEMPRIAGGIRGLKREIEAVSEDVVVVDLGDHTDRMSLITEGTGGQANIEVMNWTGYEFAAVGNNEGLTFPKESLQKLYQNAGFHVLCSNLTDSLTNQPPRHIVPYHISQSGQLRVGWISVTAPFRIFYNLLGWNVLDPFEQVKSIAEQLRCEVDLLVLLSHLGHVSDRRLAAEIPQLDLIIGAHTHQLMEHGEKVNNTFIIQAGKFGQYLGHTTIEYNADTRHIVDIRGKCLPTEEFQPDEEIVRLIEQKEQEALNVLNRPAAVLSSEIPIDWYGESPLGNLLAAGIRDWVGAEIAMVNAGQLLISLGSGPLTLKDLLQLCPHPINPCRLLLKGTYIKQILEESLMEANIRRQIKGFGFRGDILGWMCVDGMTVHYDMDRCEGERVLEIHVGGRILQEDHSYSVGTIDMFTFSRIFPAFAESQDIEYFLPEFLRDVLLKELQRKDLIDQSYQSRWILV